MRRLALTQRLLGRPLALESSRVELMRHLLAQGADDMALFGPESDRAESPCLTMAGNIAVIAIEGVLVPGFSPGWCWGGITHYGDIGLALDQALGDERVRAIVLHIDSPGGTVAGCFDLADRIFSARKVKPIAAIVNESAYSAAYAIASAAGTITVPRTGGTGSIGVVGMHVDITDMLDKEGIRVTTFQYGAYKTDGYPTTKLSDEAASRFQADIDVMGELFVNTVARNRSLPADQVRATQAGTFLGQLGVDAGLADAVMSADAAFLDFAAHLS